MKLSYETIEDSYDDTTKIRTMTEIAGLSGGGHLVRTTLYTAHHLAVDVTYVPKKAKAKFAPVE